jgi:PAS domain-containing protein
MGPDSGMFRALVERCPLVSYACAPDGTLTYISPQIEEWTGLPARLWTEDPEHWLRMLHPDDRERVESAAAPIDLGYRMRGRDGWIWVWEREVSSEGADGTLGICLDITALRHADLRRLPRNAPRSPTPRGARSPATSSTPISR